MKKELHDLVWSILPKEFKEEVKKMYKVAQSYIIGDVEINARVCESVLLELFGRHNLTSDAEGEEMLCVPRKKVEEKWQRAYEQEAKYSRAQDSPVVREELYYNRGILSILDTLFGSKCLPDELANEDNLATKEPKPAEPKFHVGQKVRFKGKDIGFEITAVEKWDDCHEYKYKLAGWKHSYRESYLEPYTEPKEEDSGFLHGESVDTLRIASEESHLRILSQESANCDKQFDNILKGGFRDHNRLHIAAMIMASMMQNAKWGDKYSHIAQLACAAADALIRETEKTAKNSN